MNSETGIVCCIKQELLDSLQPLVRWLTERGADFVIDAIAAICILLVGMLVIKLLSMSLRKALMRGPGKREMLVKFVVSVAIKASWAILIVTVLGKLGVNVGPLLAGLGVTGFVLGFAFQESLGSLAAGMMLAINEPFKVGDYVSIAGHEGTILYLDMMAVTMATADNRRITIPNKQAWGSPIVNYSALEIRRFDIAVGISYGADVTKACEIATAALASVPGVLADPAPMAEITAFADSAVALACRAWVKNSDYWKIFFAANRKIKESFDAAGISIPFPQLDVHMVQA